jgi:methyl-accepting chemotaxis protein
MQIGKGISQLCPSYEIGSLAQVFEVARTTDDVANASEKLNSTIQQITANSEETSAPGEPGFQCRPTGQPESSDRRHWRRGNGASIQEIAKSATQAAKIATSAVEVAENATATVSKLGDSSNQIGRVIKVISSIAQQTNLLALNATIEARPGRGGR